MNTSFQILLWIREVIIKCVKIFVGFCFNECGMFGIRLVVNGSLPVPYMSFMTFNQNKNTGKILL